MIFCKDKIEKNQGSKMRSAGFLFKIYPQKAIRIQLKTKS
jgi:hypothetical protein